MKLYLMIAFEISSEGDSLYASLDPEASTGRSPPERRLQKKMAWGTQASTYISSIYSYDLVCTIYSP